MIHRIRAAQGMLAAQRRASAPASERPGRRPARPPGGAQRGLESAIAARRAVLAGIDAQIQGQLAAERTRRATLAGATGAAPPPESGGGQGGFTGEASWYGPGFAGQRTADGEIFDPTKLTAASPWLPFNTMLRVTDLGHGPLGRRAHQRPAGRSGAACSTSPPTPPRSSASAAGPRSSATIL